MEKTNKQKKAAQIVTGNGLLNPLCRVPNRYGLFNLLCRVPNLSTSGGRGRQQTKDKWKWNKLQLQ